MNFKVIYAFVAISIAMFNTNVMAFSMEVTSGKISVTFSNHDIFHYMTPKLTKIGEKMITKLINKVPEDVEFDLIVAAHTDNTAIKDVNKFRYPSNWELSSYKSASIIRFIETLKKENLKSMKSISFGSSKPLFPNYTAEGRRKNRRIDIDIVFNGKDEETKRKAKLKEIASKTPQNSPTEKIVGMYSDYLYSAISTCKEIERDKIGTILFDDEITELSESNLNLINRMINYVSHRGRLISVIIEAHSSIKEDILQNNIVSIERAGNIKRHFSKLLDEQIIKVVPYSNTLTKDNSMIFGNVKINNRINISTIRCLDLYKPIFQRY